MNRKLAALSRTYQAALRKHLKHGPQATLQPARGLGRRAMTIGLETLDLARIHEQALITLVLPSYSAGTRDAMVRRAGTFFAEAITPIEQTHRTALEANARLSQMNHSLRQRTVALAASNRQLKQEIVRRTSTEESLRRSEQRSDQLLEQSRQMQEQLRLLSRQLLSAQEEERKKISRELHDVIAQTLTTINVRLANLKKEATSSTKGLDRNIARAQRLVEQSVDIVHRFARELRPTVLDDLGLIPALHTFLKSFMEETGIRVSLSAFAAVEQVNGDKRTVLYRVAQEALTNVARHAQASRAEVRIQKLDGAMCMKIKDDGKGFPAERVLHAKKNKRLGLLGMRERLEMVNGSFTVESVPGKGTTIQARIPFADGRARGSGETR
jgi:signal transduction histidine kinase